MIPNVNPHPYTEVEASVVMGETKYNPVAKKVQQSPAQVNIQKVETMLTV